MKIFDYEKNFMITKDNALEYADKIGEFLKERLKIAGKDGYVLGLSGGLDSAVAAYLCAHSGIKLYLIMMPYGETMSKTGSGVRAGFVITGLDLEKYSTLIDIRPACELANSRRDRFVEAFTSDRPNLQQDLRLASENRRARQRMIELYDFAQVNNLLVLGTGNLDEYCLGYFTKYGDGASDIEPLQFLLKSEVRILGEALGVDQSILNCAPSAELSDGQTDEGDLGFTYDDFDRFAITGSSGDPEIDAKIRHKYHVSQHKRELPPAFEA